MSLNDADELHILQASARVNGAFTKGLASYKVPLDRLGKAYLTEPNPLLALEGAPVVDLDALAAKVAALMPPAPSAESIAAAIISQLKG
jgi:hypothetical protein